MHLPKNDVPTKVEAPGVTARQITDFGDASNYGSMAGEYLSLASGTDIAPLLQGLKDDDCHAPHWGYMLSGELSVTYRDGTDETCAEGDMFYWPPGHSLRVTRDAEFILFSPQNEHNEVFDHMTAKMAGG